MRVLHLYKDYFPIVGGIENHIRTVAEGLRSYGVESTVLVTNTNSQTLHESIDGVPVIKTGRQLNISSAPVSLPLYPWLHKLSKDCDLVHTHAPYPPGEIGQLLFGRSKRFVVTYHSDIVRQRVMGVIYGPLLRIVLQKARLVAVSNPVYIQDSLYLRFIAEKCRVIPFGVDLQTFTRTPAIETKVTELRKRFKNQPLLLFIGRLRHYKGVNVLIEAMRQIPNAHALIVGIGPLEQELKVQASGLGDRITFLGELSDEDALVARYAADVFVFPSTNRAETFGIAQIEAMACGLPVICTELGTGTSWVNQHGETGLVVPPSEPIALANAIQQILSNENLRRQMGKAAAKRAQEQFSIDAMLNRLIEFYNEALDAKR